MERLLLVVWVADKDVSRAAEGHDGRRDKQLTRRSSMLVLRTCRGTYPNSFSLLIWGGTGGAEAWARERLWSLS